jgi:hypothetical protein
VSQGSIKFRLFTGVRQGAKRKLGLLEGDEQLNTRSGIASLRQNQKRDFLSRMQHWLDGANGPKNWFHNFPGDSICPDLFVFKVGDHRFYGYLYHPLPKTNPGLQACVLCSHGIKDAWETDPNQKRLMQRRLQSNDAKMAIAEMFDDRAEEVEKRGKPSWKM